MRVVVVGAGIGGMVAALELAARGEQVTVLEKSPVPGGKLRETRVGQARLDTGPTVLTMRWVFEEIFANAGAHLESRLALRPLDVLARHAWRAGEHLDLYADLERTCAAIGAFAGPREAAGYRRFCARAAQIYATLEAPFIRSACSGPRALAASVGLSRLAELWRIAPFTSLQRALAGYFRDPRLLQLFGRYATYCGSSPYRAPATLMLVAHVERKGVWSVEGGMHRLALAVEKLAVERGVNFRYEAEVGRIEVAGSRVTAVTLAGGERIAADAVVVNADVAALASGHFGDTVASAVEPTAPSERSLSAMTWAVVARTKGFPLVRHTVFFSSDYRAEFDDLLVHGRLPQRPTVYVCAQDRTEAFDAPARGPERLFCIVNAPATGDHARFTPQEIARCKEQTFDLLRRCGLQVDLQADQMVATTPDRFDSLYPGTGGALYGRASHGWNASFRRPGARTPITGLYLAGGSTHPGPGLPMAALSGRIAAQALLEDRSSISRSATMAMHGGMSTRSATTGDTQLH